MWHFLYGQVKTALSEILDRYTISVLYETCWDAWAQKYSSVSNDAGNGVISNWEHNVIKALNPDW